MREYRKTAILITSLHTGGTEVQTQAVIDALQARGWNVVWGIGTSLYCSDDEAAVFRRDFQEAVATHVMGEAA